MKPEDPITLSATEKEYVPQPGEPPLGFPGFWDPPASAYYDPATGNYRMAGLDYLRASIEKYGDVQ